MRKSALASMLIVFVLCIGAALLIVNGISARSHASQTALVLSSVRSAALACYAAEGAYPSDLAYLKRHYGLRYDESVYQVSYQAFASNIFPDIYVLEGGGGR